jgi:hypothetical protein
VVVVCRVVACALCRWGGLTIVSMLVADVCLCSMGNNGLRVSEMCRLGLWWAGGI